MPLDWAATQNELGFALQRLAERESGTAHLEQAVAAYRSALEEYTRARAPFQWAGTQHNLGSALEKLAMREKSAPRMKGSTCLHAGCCRNVSAKHEKLLAEQGQEPHHKDGSGADEPAAVTHPTRFPRRLHRGLQKIRIMYQN